MAVVCERCRAPVTEAQTQDGERLVLENYSEPTGDNRYAVVSFDSTPWTAVPLDGSSPVDGYTDHKVRCPFQ